ncbi:FtsX-like permease family protein [Arcanobacterium hippocoleae]
MKTIGFAAQLTAARLRMHQGAALLDSFAVIAFAAASLLTLTTFGGMWMFWQRMPSANHSIAQALDIPNSTISGIGETYVLLSCIAFGLLVVPLLSLGMDAARLGAQGRVKRLASLRLIGMSAWRIQKLSLIETMVQYLIGFTIGFAIYLATLPAWHLISFQGKHIGTFEMLLPWWGIFATLFFLALLAALSTFLGLVRVSISPLGVARRFSPRSLRWWRFGVLAAALAFAITVFMSINTRYLANTRDIILAIAAAMVLIIVGVSVAGPLFIQLTARFGLLTKRAAKLLAARRIIDDPRAAWRNVSAVSLIGLVTALVVSGGFISLEASNITDNTMKTMAALAKHDITIGILIVFVFTLLLGAVSTLIQQASDVFDRAPEQRALINTGVPFGVFAAARLRQVIWPYTVTTLLGVAVGILPGFSYRLMNNQQIGSDMIILLVMVGLGTAITFAAAALTIPIERQVLTAQSRRND